MQCDNLVRLIKDWYLSVKQETMAPVRMMQFVDKHIKNCAVCQADLQLALEVEKIRELVVPEAKSPKAAREISPDEDEIDGNNDEEE